MFSNENKPYADLENFPNSEPRISLSSGDWKNSFSNLSKDLSQVAKDANVRGFEPDESNENEITFSATDLANLLQKADSDGASLVATLLKSQLAAKLSSFGTLEFALQKINNEGLNPTLEKTLVSSLERNITKLAKVKEIINLIKVAMQKIDQTFSSPEEKKQFLQKFDQSYSDGTINHLEEIGEDLNSFVEKFKIIIELSKKVPGLAEDELGEKFIKVVETLSTKAEETKKLLVAA